MLHTHPLGPHLDHPLPARPAALAHGRDGLARRHAQGVGHPARGGRKGLEGPRGQCEVFGLCGCACASEDSGGGSSSSSSSGWGWGENEEKEGEGLEVG
jgi:hypothetical protein